MVEQSTREMIAEKAIIHAEAPAYIRNAPVDRSFELPTVLYGATVAFFLGFLAVMTVGFGNPELAIPMAIFTLFIVAGFGVPAVWTRLGPENLSRPKTWSRFVREGVMTPFGLSKARDATVQVLILPALIFLWGVAAVTIAAIVS